MIDVQVRDGDGERERERERERHTPPCLRHALDLKCQVKLERLVRSTSIKNGPHGDLTTNSLHLTGSRVGERARERGRAAKWGGRQREREADRQEETISRWQEDEVVSSRAFAFTGNKDEYLQARYYTSIYHHLFLL